MTYVIISKYKRNLIRIFSALFVLYLLIGSQVYSEPAVTEITGTISHNETITINGSGFGTKEPAKPLVWADFENGINPTNLGIKTSWGKDHLLTLTTNNQPHNSTHVAVNEYKRNKNTGSSFCVDYNYYEKIYAFWKRYRDFTPPKLNMKFFRIWCTDGSKNDFLAAYFAASSPDKVGRCYTENTTDYTNGYSSTYQGTIYTEDLWETEEFRWSQNSAINIADGTWRFWRNGNLQQSRDNIVGRDSNNYGNITRLYTDNYSGGGGNDSNLPPDGSKVYMDDIYIDNTWARVMIGDQYTFASSTKREIQIPSAWSETSIKINMNQGSFSEGDNAYLYVVDSSGNASGGFPIIIGGDGSSFTAPPVNTDEVSELKDNENDEMQIIATPRQNPEIVWLPQGIDLTKHSMGPFTVKVRVEGIDEQRYPSIIPRIRYYMGTGSSLGYLDMIKEGDNIWRFDIPDPRWYRYRSKSLRYQVKVFDEEGNVITESRWQKELIDSFVRDYK